MSTINTINLSPSTPASATSAGFLRPSASVLQQINEEDGVPTKFDVHTVYRRALANDDISMPIAAILALSELIAQSKADTMSELVEELKNGAETLKRKTPNPISLTAGCELFIRYVTTARQDYGRSFRDHKQELVRQGHLYADNTCREDIARHALGFIKDDAVILTHSYSRVVMQTLLHANRHKRISVYVTEARPRGLGVKTHEALTAAGIPCTVVLDSAVAYVMDKVDMVLVGSEAVVESGGLINAVGSYQTAIIAKAMNKPVYALAESYKFLRLFPLSQYDLPSHSSQILALPSYRPTQSLSRAPSDSGRRTMTAPPTPLRNVSRSMTGYFSGTSSFSMSMDQLAKNPDVDYTRPDLITLVFSDVGILTPDGVSQFLVGIFAE